MLEAQVEVAQSPSLGQLQAMISAQWQLPANPTEQLNYSTEAVKVQSC